MEMRDFYFFSEGRSYQGFRDLGLSGQLVYEPGEGVHIGRDPDVLDTWFSSGLWPIGTLGWPDQTPEMEKYFPTDPPSSPGRTFCSSGWRG